MLRIVDVLKITAVMLVRVGDNLLCLYVRPDSIFIAVWFAKVKTATTGKGKYRLYNQAT